MIWMTVSNPRTFDLKIFREDPRKGQSWHVVRILKILSTKTVVQLAPFMNYKEHDCAASLKTFINIYSFTAEY